MERPMIITDADIPVVAPLHHAPLGVALELAEQGVTVSITLTDAAGVALWEVAGESGVTRLHGRPPADILARVEEFHVYLETVPLAGEAPTEPYVARLACGCMVRYTYRPALVAHCPTHDAQRVHRVDYPITEAP